jgi:precorrin-6B methylase 2
MLATTPPAAGTATAAEGEALVQAENEGGNAGYFGGYSNISIHETMLRDQARTLAYMHAIQHHAAFIKGKVVLDVGCGTGILSLFAARAGAAKVGQARPVYPAAPLRRLTARCRCSQWTRATSQSRPARWSLPTASMTSSP